MQSPVILDIAGIELSEADRRRLAHPLVGGLILFGRNWRSRDQLLRLCLDIKAIRADLLICVDHEGGRVQRFRSDGMTHLPPMRALGEIWMEGAGPMQAIRAATACGFVLASELRSCGVDISFAPVLDLDHGASGVIGDRAFARDPRVVSLLAQSLNHGLLRGGMANCGKHFPGHGYVRADSHTEVPVDRRGLKAILAEDAAPYGWLSMSLAAVMPAHVIYPRVDRRPAGFSRRWLAQILRGRLRFQGAVFSDDLAMAGARTIDGRVVSFCDAALAALAAGCDMVLLCNQTVAAAGADNGVLDELLCELEQALKRGGWAASQASDERRRSLLPRTAAYPWDELMLRPDYIQALDLIP